jgi:hypothetical protein
VNFINLLHIIQMNNVGVCTALCMRKELRHVSSKGTIVLGTRTHTHYPRYCGVPVVPCGVIFIYVIHTHAHIYRYIYIDIYIYIYIYI